MTVWPRRAELGNAAGRAAKLWQDALASPLHNPFCACIGAGVVNLGARSLEQDLLDYLEPRHAEDSQVAALLKARRTDPTGPFSAWLSHVTEQLPGRQSERLLSDVTDVLQSIVDMSPGSRFACV